MKEQLTSTVSDLTSTKIFMFYWLLYICKKIVYLFFAFSIHKKIVTYKKKTKELEEEYKAWKTLMKQRKQTYQAAERYAWSHAFCMLQIL